MNSSPTCAPELLAFNLADALVSQPSGVAAARSAGLNRVVKQVVCQPLQVTVTHKGILGQMTEGEKGERREGMMGLSRGPHSYYSCRSRRVFCNTLQPFATLLIAD